MATLRKRKGSNIWFVDYMRDGKRIRKSTGTPNKQEAEKRLIEGKLGRGILRPENEKVLLSEYIEEYLEYSESEKAPKTVEIDKRALNNFLDHVGDKYISAVKYKEAEAFKINRKKEVKPVSVNMELRQLKAAFEKAIHWDYLQKNPFKQVTQCKVKHSNLPRFLTKEEVRKLLEIIPEGTFKNYVLFCLYTGCRRNEGLDLTWDDINLDAGTVTFQVTKTGVSRIVPFNAILLRMIQTMDKRKSRPFSFLPGYVTHKFKDYVRASGFKNMESIRLHSLRHTYASHLVMEGIDLTTVAKLLGHSTVRTTEMYAHLAPDHMKAAVERLRY